MINHEDALMYGRPREYWEENARKAWTDLGNPPPAPGDQRFDAFRHAFTSATWTRAFGETVAKAGGDAIEGWRSDNFDNGEAATRDMYGDLLNNARGRELGKNAHPGWTQETLAKEVYDLLENGKLVTDPQTDKDTLPENFPRELVVPKMRPIGQWARDLPSDIADEVGNLFGRALAWLFPKDPLTLDLDNDGIETIGIDPANPIHFDHNAEGIKTATGWIKGDDGLVVLDRNGNDAIDSGRELFGDNTKLANGELAANGFAALADLDANGDGKLDASDAAFTNLRVWQDTNQDGVSQATELKTLSALGITSIATIGSQTDVNLGNGRGRCVRNGVGNPQPLGATYTKANGSKGVAGIAGAARACFRLHKTRRHSKRLPRQTSEQNRSVAGVLVQ